MMPCAKSRGCSQSYYMTYWVLLMKPTLLALVNAAMLLCIYDKHQAGLLHPDNYLAQVHVLQCMLLVKQCLTPCLRDLISFSSLECVKIVWSSATTDESFRGAAGFSPFRQKQLQTAAAASARQQSIAGRRATCAQRIIHTGMPCTKRS